MIAISAHAIIPNIKGPTLLTCRTLLKSVLFSSSAIYMNSNLSVDLAGCNTVTTAHLLPCKIFYDGPANVDKFITDNSERCSLFGRSLEPARRNLPSGYSGYILRTSSSNSSNKVLSGEMKVNSVIEWGHDEAPNEYSQVNSVLRYIDVITKMHLS
jgi:hypothetical protein